MKYLDLTPVTDSAQLRLKKGTIEYLQEASSDILPLLGLGVAGASPNYDTAIPLRLYGCEKTTTGLNTYKVEDGLALYDGKICRVIGGIFTYTAPTTLIITVETIDSATLDPVTLTDTTTANIHKEYRLVIETGSAGAGLIDWDNFYIPKIESINSAGVYSLNVSYLSPNLIRLEGWIAIDYSTSSLGCFEYKTISGLRKVFADNKCYGTAVFQNTALGVGLYKDVPAIECILETFENNADKRIKIKVLASDLSIQNEDVGLVIVSATFRVIE